MLTLKHSTWTTSAHSICKFANFFHFFVLSLIIFNACLLWQRPCLQLHCEFRPQLLGLHKCIKIYVHEKAGICMARCFLQPHGNYLNKFYVDAGIRKQRAQQASLVLVVPLLPRNALFFAPLTAAGGRRQAAEGRPLGSGPRDYDWCKVSKSTIWQMPGASNLMQLSITDKRKSKLLIKRNKSLFASLAKRATALDITPPSSSATGITMQCSCMPDRVTRGQAVRVWGLLRSSCCLFEGCLFLLQANLQWHELKAANIWLFGVASEFSFYLNLKLVFSRRDRKC